MKAGWQLKKLSEVCIVERGSSPRPIKNYFTTSPDGVNWIKISDTEAGAKYVHSTAQKITQEGARQSRFVKEGDFILTNSMSFGRPYIMKTSGYIHDGWFVLRLNDALNSDYFYHLLSSDLVQHQFIRLASGSVVQNISGDLVKMAVLPIAPLPEQRRIVRILDEAFESIAKAKATAEKNLANSRALFESYIESVFSSDRGCVEKRLGDANLLEIIDGDRGVHYPKTSDFSNAGHCLFLNTKNVRPNGFDFATTTFITPKKDEKLRKGKLTRGDVVLTTRGTIGNIGLYSEDVPFDHLRINSGMLILRANKTSLAPTFLFELLRSQIIKRQIKEQTTGAAQPQLPIKTLVNFRIPVPLDLKQQEKVVDRLRAFEPQIQRLAAIYTRKLTALDELKKSLLHEAFNGQF